MTGRGALMTTAAIEAKGLVKAFGKVRALDGIDMVARVIRSLLWMVGITAVFSTLAIAHYRRRV